MKRWKTGGVSQCHHCNSQLMRTKGGFIFEILLDPLGNPVRVHKSCVDKQLGLGYRLPNPKPGVPYSEKCAVGLPGYTVQPKINEADE